MPANLNDPFGESCCDGGQCSTVKESAQSCGCDLGAKYVCDRHKLDNVKVDLRWFLDHIDFYDYSDPKLSTVFHKLYEWTTNGE